MKFLHLLAVIGVVGLKFAAAVTCENESDPDSGYNGNWYVASPLRYPQHSAITLSRVPILLICFSGAAVMMGPAGISTLPIHVRMESLF